MNVPMLPGFDLGITDARQVGEVSRAKSLYGVHSYHTKVPPEAIEPYILEYAQPGATILDPFCGSGMTGVAARRLGRHALLSDLSPAAAHIASNYTTPCDPAAYGRAVERVTGALAATRVDLYGTRCHSCSGPAVTAYVIWSDVRRCPHCEVEIRLWDYRADGLRKLSCRSCGRSYPKKSAPLVRETPVRVSLDCPACGRLERDPSPEDLGHLLRSRDAIPAWYPDVAFGPEREMWRRGHQDLGIQSVADFYSGRNLWALSVLWAEIGAEADLRLRSALQFTFTAIANRASRRYQWNAKRPTNVLGGTLYVSSLRYEFNVFSLWSRKVAAVKKLFQATLNDPGSAEVAHLSATRLPFADRSIDYCFTDPPFGANIVYSDCSLLWEAWLGDLMDPREEAIVTRHRSPSAGGKTVSEYAHVMATAFSELRRVLKEAAPATLVFQNTDPAVWVAVQEAISDTGFVVLGAETLHKTQPSFKGVKAQEEGEQVAATDVVLLLRSGGASRTSASKESVWDVIWRALAVELDRVGDRTGRRRSIPHLYAVAFAAAVAASLPTQEITFESIERLLLERGALNRVSHAEVSANVAP